ncbi:hypothetical protein GCM10009109_00930 [Marinobacterium sediminicola]
MGTNKVQRFVGNRRRKQEFFQAIQFFFSNEGNIGSHGSKIRNEGNSADSTLKRLRGIWLQDDFMRGITDNAAHD